MARFFTLVVAAAASATALAAPWTLRLVDPATGGLCLDGSPSGFWIRDGVGADANKFVIHLQGGGVSRGTRWVGRTRWLYRSEEVRAWRVKVATLATSSHHSSQWCVSLSDCLARSTTTLGSSKQWPAKVRGCAIGG